MKAGKSFLRCGVTLLGLGRSGASMVSGSAFDGVFTCFGFAKVDGLQVKITSGASNGVIGIGSSKINMNGALWASNNIVWGVLNGNNSSDGIIRHDPNGLSTGFSLYAWNNVVHGFLNGPGTHYQGGIYCDVGNCYAYNNTVYGCYTGFTNDAATSYTVKNNISYGNTINYGGWWGFSASSTNNLSGPSLSDAPGSNPQNATTVSFIDLANNDAHISPCDIGARDHGADLSYDKYITLSTDIDGQVRSGTWDIGADEYDGDNIRGYAWSSNYGWISMNCLNDSSCSISNYGVKICDTGCSPSNRFNFYGYAWSSGAGWISFNSTGAPDYSFGSHCKNTCNSSNNCTSCFNPDDGNIYGWAQIVNLGVDGWIRLGTTTMSSGIYIDQTSVLGQFRGWGWNGNSNPFIGAGWISFNCQETGNCGTSNYFVYLDSPHLPLPINLSSPNWSNANACPAPGAQSGVALNAFLRWQYNNPYSCLSQTAFQTIFL